MKSNITLKLDASIIQEARVLAARRGISVSRMLAEELEQIVRREKSYETAKTRAMKRLGSGLDLDWTPLEDRQGLYER
jgi:hypothetical protein